MSYYLLLLRLVPVPVWVCVLVVSAHGHLPPPVVVPESLLPVGPDSIPILVVLVSSFPTPVFVCVRIHLPPARLECRDWIDNWSGRSIRCLTPTRMLRTLLSIRHLLLEFVISTRFLTNC